MFFLLSKIVSFFLSPGLWLVALAVWRFAVKNPRHKKRLLLAIVVVFVVFGNQFLFNKVATSWQPEPVAVNSMGSYSVGILLGGLGSFDQYNRGYLNGASDRLVEICALYHQKKIGKMVMSGGNAYNDDRPDEAPFLRQKAMELGVDSSDIIIEDRSRSTFENAIFTKKILDSLRLRPPFVLVTSAMHMPRAQLSFAKAGVPVVPFPSNFTVWPNRENWRSVLLPEMETLLKWDGFLKEVVGLLAYKLFNKA